MIHPSIDAAIQLRNEHKPTADQIARIDLKVHPLVLELTAKRTPHIGLEGKFSVCHSVAVAIIEGAAGERQYSDRAVRDPHAVALRQRARDRQPGGAHERPAARGQVPRPCQRGNSSGAGAQED